MKISKEGFFEMAHRLSNYDGACNNIHGHSYYWKVEINAQENNKTNMVLDYAELKKIMMEFDHCLLLSSNESHIKLQKFLIDENICNKNNVHLVLWEPTAEEMAKHFCYKISEAMRIYSKGAAWKNIKVILKETNSSEIEVNWKAGERLDEN